MGYNVSLVDENDHILKVPSHLEGSNICVGGSDISTICITYNYSKFYYDENTFGKEGLYYLNGKKAVDAIPILESSVEFLKDNPSDDYWNATPGNAGHCLNVLLSWGRIYPSGIFKIS